MADLVLDGAALARLRADLAGVVELLERPARRLTALDAAVAGTTRLCGRLDYFAEEWSYGIGRLGGLARTSVDALDQVQGTFGEVEAALTQALSGRATDPSVGSR